FVPPIHPTREQPLFSDEDLTHRYTRADALRDEGAPKPVVLDPRVHRLPGPLYIGTCPWEARNGPGKPLYPSGRGVGPTRGPCAPRRGSPCGGRATPANPRLQRMQSSGHGRGERAVPPSAGPVSSQDTRG